MRINSIKLQLPVLTSAKSRLIARLKGDGSLFVAGKNKTNYYLKFFSVNDNELKVFSDDIKEVYGLKTKTAVKQSGKNPLKYVKNAFIRSKLAYEDMKRYGNFGSYDWSVPKDILGASIEIKSEFLRTFAEDEGSVLINNREVRIYSINENGLMQLADLFKDFGIETGIKKGYGVKRNVFGLIIRGKERLIKFRDFIGFRSESKSKKLDILISSFKR